MHWHQKIAADAIWWQDYLDKLNHLSTGTFPDCEQLNSLFSVTPQSAGGANIQFVCSTFLEEGSYEDRIYKGGQISTRPDSWHDLFNALVWLRFPRIKSALNSLHFHARTDSPERGRLRDALTLFDECGVLLVSSREDILQAIAQRDWCKAFQKNADFWLSDITPVTFGHAMLEKYLAPYKSMTANALLVHIDADLKAMARTDLLLRLDTVISKKLLDAEALTHPAALTPLPIAGIPGWDICGPQTPGFYADSNVFRPAPETLVPAPILYL